MKRVDPGRVRARQELSGRQHTLVHMGVRLEARNVRTTSNTFSIVIHPSLRAVVAWATQHRPHRGCLLSRFVRVPAARIFHFYALFYTCLSRISAAVVLQNYHRGPDKTGISFHTRGWNTQPETHLIRFVGAPNPARTSARAIVLIWAPSLRTALRHTAATDWIVRGRGTPPNTHTPTSSTG